MRLLRRLLKTNVTEEKRKSKYYNYVNKSIVHNHNIFIECNKLDDSFLDKLFTKDLLKEYTIYLVTNKKYKNNNINLIKKNSKKYYELLSNSKYIITDYLLNDYYIKKDGQVVINYWDYRDVDYLGRKSVDNYFDIGNVQRTFMNSDYMVFTNVDSKNNIIDNYMLSNLISGKIIVERNFIKVLETILLNKNNKIKYEKSTNNKKENILIYSGNLSRNGITSSLKNLLMNVDTKKKNYFITYDVSLASNNKEQLLDLRDDINYIAINSNTVMTIKDNIKFYLYRANALSLSKIINKMKNIYSLEIKRLFPGMNISTAIQFGGYDFRKIFLFSNFDCNKVIYVHSNMIDEIKTRKRQHRPTLEYAYNVYDKVAVVSDILIDSVKEISKRDDNIFEAKNVIDYQTILNKSKLDISFDSFTEANKTLDELKVILKSKSKKFITIGRFSPEKGHDRLINSFDKLYKENKDIYLIIIGGHGDEYNNTVKLVNSLESKNNIILIKNISNPYNILSKCNYFVLPSHYEGFGLVLAEADIVNVPVISTNLDGPRKFMDQNKGVLVENSEDGILDGMKMLLNNKVKVMHVDYKKYNAEALNEFYKLLDGDKK